MQTMKTFSAKPTDVDRKWFIVDAIGAGLGGILTPLPGPNVFFFYPAIRALGHYLVRKGAGHASRLLLSLNGEPLIDRVEKSGLPDLGRVRGELKLLEERYSMDPLEELLGSEIYGRSHSISEDRNPF